VIATDSQAAIEWFAISECYGWVCCLNVAPCDERGKELRNASGEMTVMMIMLISVTELHIMLRRGLNFFSTIYS
jgi:hypothetical protein